MGSGWHVVSVASLTPFEDGYDYVAIHHWLSHLHGPENSTNNGWYMAPVYLPDGAIITRLSVYWKKTGDTAEGLVRLQRSQLGVGNFQELAIVDSSASTSGTFVERDDTISYDEVDNTQCAYWLVYDLPADADLQAGSAVIQYIPPLASQTGVLSIPAAAFHPEFALLFR